jgi:hypothetical protein
MGLMVSVEKTRISFRIMIRKPEGKKPLEDVGVYDRICKNIL